MRLRKHPHSSCSRLKPWPTHSLSELCNFFYISPPDTFSGEGRTDLAWLLVWIVNRIIWWLCRIREHHILYVMISEFLVLVVLNGSNYAGKDILHKCSAFLSSCHFPIMARMYNSNRNNRSAKIKYHMVLLENEDL